MDQTTEVKSYIELLRENAALRALREQAVRLARHLRADMEAGPVEYNKLYLQAYAILAAFEEAPALQVAGGVRVSVPTPCCERAFPCGTGSCVAD